MILNAFTRIPTAALLLVLSVASLMDYVTTAKVLEFCADCEANIFMVYAMDLFGGHHGGILIAKLIGLSALIFFYPSDMGDARAVFKKPIYAFTLWIGALAYILATAMNTYLLTVIA